MYPCMYSHRSHTESIILFNPLFSQYLFTATYLENQTSFPTYATEFTLKRSEVQALTLLTHTHAICMRLSAGVEETASPPAVPQELGDGGADCASGQRSWCDKLWYSAVSAPHQHKLSYTAARIARSSCVFGGRWLHIERSACGGRCWQYITVGRYGEWRAGARGVWVRRLRSDRWSTTLGWP